MFNTLEPNMGTLNYNYYSYILLQDQVSPKLSVLILLSNFTSKYRRKENMKVQI